MRNDILQLKEVEFMPFDEDLQDGILYNSERFGVAVHLCCCGCGMKTVTPINESRGWTLSKMESGPTLRPSIGNMQFPCKSHYYITNGRIEWL